MEKQAPAAFRLSPQQKTIWQGQSEDHPWNAVCLVTLHGRIDQQRLQQALLDLVLRYEVLRTVYRLQPGMKVPFQILADQLEPEWHVLDLAGVDPAARQVRIDDALDRQRKQKFDLEKGPSVRSVFIVLDDASAALIVSLPSLSSDARSLNTFVRDLGSIYARASQPHADDPLRYAQFAQWQIDLLESSDEAAEEAQAFWKQQSRPEMGSLFLPEAKSPAGPFQPESVSETLPVPVLNSLAAVAQKHAASAENVLLAAWQSLVWRVSGNTNFETRFFADSREYEELEHAIGAIGKFLPIRARFDGDFSFKDIVSQVVAAISAAVPHQEYLAAGAGSEAGNSVSFEYVPLDAERTYDDVTFAIKDCGSYSEKFALRLFAFPNAEGLRIELHYDGGQFNQETAKRWLNCYITLLSAALDDQSTPVARLPLLTPAERGAMVHDWNCTETDYPRDRRLHELFEDQAKRTPLRCAVRGGEKELTYGELNEKANQLARHLGMLGVKSGTMVGLALERGVDLITGMMAILKAGGAYVPLSTDNPKPRLQQQLDNIFALVTESRLSDRIPAFGGPRVCLDSDSGRWVNESGSNPEAPGSAEDLMYVIFTSGSTGVPKGVGVRHRNLVNYAEFIRRTLGLSEASEAMHFATVSTLNADLGNTTVFPSLISGGCLHVIDHETASDSARMAAYCLQHPIDVLKIVPSHLEALLETNEGGGVLPRKVLVLGGESSTWRLIRRVRSLSARCRILNHYGPTETTVGSLTFPVDHPGEDTAANQTVPIGRPIANTQVYILDGLLQPVPVGVVGELYISGDGVTAGYVGQPELTRERFLPNPFCAGIMYRTGDLARYRADRNVEFLGRADDQVKIRGFRVEPGEVEAVIRRYPGVKQVVVVARQDKRGDMRLIGYVVVDPAQNPSTALLRAYLEEQLPDYMVPTALALLPKLPLTTNGKVDRQNLPEPEQIEARAFVAPRTETEIAVAAIWSDVFRRGEIGAHDHFFEIGGHSLTATQVISRVREQFHVTLDMRVVFERPTVEGMANAIDAARKEPVKSEPALVAVSRERYRRN